MAGQPLDRNAKAPDHGLCARLVGAAQAAGQHRGPLTRATLEVLEALLWGFHNSRDGRCFPSYETIAKRRTVLPGYGLRGDPGAGGGGDPDLGEPADPGASFRSWICSARWRCARG